MNRLLIFTLIFASSFLLFASIEAAQPQTTSINIVDSPGFSPNLAFGLDGLPIIADNVCGIISSNAISNFRTVTIFDQWSKPGSEFGPKSAPASTPLLFTNTNSEPVITATLFHYGDFLTENDLRGYESFFEQAFQDATDNLLRLDIKDFAVVSLPIEDSTHKYSDTKLKYPWLRDESLDRIWYYDNFNITSIVNEGRNALAAASPQLLQNDVLIMLTEAQFEGLGYFVQNNTVITEQPAEVAWAKESFYRTDTQSIYQLVDELIHELGHYMGLTHTCASCMASGILDQECCAQCSNRNDVMSYCRVRPSATATYYNKFLSCTFDFLQSQFLPAWLAGSSWGYQSVPCNGTSDTTPPTVSITSPSNNSTLSGMVTVSATASDNAGVSKVEFYHDNINLIGSDTLSPYSINWDTRSLSNGSYTLTAKVYDTAGNVSTSSTINVNVNNLSPTPTVDLKANGSAGPITISYNGAATLSWTSTNATSCTASGEWSGTKSVSGSQSTGNLTSNKTFILICTGSGGSGQDSVTVQVSPPPPPSDTTPPTVSITSPTSGLTVCCNVAIAAEASDNIGITKVEFWLNARDLLATDTTTTQPYSYLWDTTTVSNGDYTIAAKAYDAAGNTAISNFSTVTIFNQQPEPKPEPEPEPTPPPLLVKLTDHPRIYQIINGKKHWIPNPETFISYGFDWELITTISQQELDSYPRIKLVKTAISPKVYYITESGMKRWIPTAEIFLSYGNKWGDIVTINSTELNFYIDNTLIHLDNDPKIYKLEGNTKRWIKTAEAFNGLGYDWQKIAPLNTTELNFYSEGIPIE